MQKKGLLHDTLWVRLCRVCHFPNNSLFKFSLAYVQHQDTFLNNILVSYSLCDCICQVIWYVAFLALLDCIVLFQVVLPSLCYSFQKTLPYPLFSAVLVFPVSN